MPQRPRLDSKSKALRDCGCLNTKADRVKDPLFQASEFFDPRDLVQVKYEMLRRVDVDSQSVTQTAGNFAFSRPSFYEARASLAREGLPGLVPKKRGPRGGHKLTEEIVAFVAREMEADPTLETGGLADRVRERFGVSVHPRSVERALERRRKKAR